MSWDTINTAVAKRIIGTILGYIEHRMYELRRVGVEYSNGDLPIIRGVD